MKSSEVVSWIHQNRTQITDKFLEHRDYLIKKDKAYNEFDFNQYELSEMGLCIAVNSLRLPKGYTSTMGNGRVIDTVGRKRFHVFATSGDNVLCFTPGWFLADQGFNQPGDALRHLISLAPELFIPTETIIALNGSKKEIHDKLNLQYTW